MRTVNGGSAIATVAERIDYHDRLGNRGLRVVDCVEQAEKTVLLARLRIRLNVTFASRTPVDIIANVLGEWSCGV
jgi:hypothetical protein